MFASDQGTKDERYNILLQLAFEKIKKDKLVKKPRKTKERNPEHKLRHRS